MVTVGVRQSRARKKRTMRKGGKAVKMSVVASGFDVA